jgi:hypothetical protein
LLLTVSTFFLLSLTFLKYFSFRFIALPTAKDACEES